MIEIYEASKPEHYKFIIEILAKTLPKAYINIYSREEIDKMIHSFYSLESLKMEVEDKGKFIICNINGIHSGFASFETNRKNTNMTMIFKLFVIPEAQRNGICAKKLYHYIVKEAKKENNIAIRWGVKSNNTYALNIYLKYGGKIIEKKYTNVLGHNELNYIIEKNI